MLLAYIAGTFGFSYPLMVGFLVPLRARELGVSLDLIGVLVAAASIVAATTSIPSGALTERIGPRRAYLLGTAVSTLTTPFFALTSSYGVMLLLQLVFGPFRITGWVAAQTYITGVGAPEERASITGRFAFATNVGTMVAPLVVGAIAEAVGFRLAFPFVALAGLGYVLVGLALPELPRPVGGVAKRASEGIGGFRTAVELLRLRGIQVVVILTFVRVWYQAGWSAFFPLYLVNERGLAPSVAGTVLSSASAVATVAALGAGPLARRASAELVTAAALGLGALGVALSPHLATVPLVYLPTILYGAGVGLSLPLLIAVFSEESPPGRRGVAFGVRVAANQSAAIVSPIAAGQLLIATNITLGFLASSAFAWVLLGGAVWLHLSGHRRRQGPSH